MHELYIFFGTGNDTRPISAEAQQQRQSDDNITESFTPVPLSHGKILTGSNILRPWIWEGGSKGLLILCITRYTT